jgi:hypothetical protein
LSQALYALEYAVAIISSVWDTTLSTWLAFHVKFHVCCGMWHSYGWSCL